MIFEIDYNVKLVEEGICEIEADSLEEALEAFKEQPYDYIDDNWYSKNFITSEANGIRLKGDNLWQ